MTGPQRLAIARTLILDSSLPLDPCGRPNEWEDYYTNHHLFAPPDTLGPLWRMLWHLACGDPCPSLSEFDESVMEREDWRAGVHAVMALGGVLLAGEVAA